MGCGVSNGQFRTTNSLESLINIMEEENKNIRTILNDLEKDPNSEQIKLGFYRLSLNYADHNIDFIKIKHISKLNFEKLKILVDFFYGAIYRGTKDDLKISYVVSPDLISGIELDASYLRISWNVGNYLDSLENELSMMFVKIPHEDIKS
jgi:F0F1-type ATP synthase delta subunit